MYADFERIFDRYADNAYIAAYALGVDGRRATAAQKKAFSDAFTGYIARKYGKRFREFIGGRLEVKGVRRREEPGTRSRTTAYLRGEAPFDGDLPSCRTGPASDLFFNMFIEGVNLLLTERTEIGAMLDRRRRQHRRDDRRPDAARADRLATGSGPFRAASVPAQKVGAALARAAILPPAGPDRACLRRCCGCSLLRTRHRNGGLLPARPRRGGSGARSMGRGGTGTPSCTRVMTSCQISAGRPPPVTPVSGVLSS